MKLEYWNKGVVQLFENTLFSATLSIQLKLKKKAKNSFFDFKIAE